MKKKKEIGLYIYNFYLSVRYLVINSKFKLTAYFFATWVYYWELIMKKNKIKQMKY